MFQKVLLQGYRRNKHLVTTNKLRTLWLILKASGSTIFAQNSALFSTNDCLYWFPCSPWWWFKRCYVIFVYLSRYLYIYSLASGIFILLLEIWYAYAEVCWWATALIYCSERWLCVVNLDTKTQLEEFILLGLIPACFSYLQIKQAAEGSQINNPLHIIFSYIIVRPSNRTKKSMQLLIFIESSLCARQFSNVVCESMHLILNNTLWGKYWYYPDLEDDITKVHRV